MQCSKYMFLSHCLKITYDMIRIKIQTGTYHFRHFKSINLSAWYSRIYMHVHTFGTGWDIHYISVIVKIPQWRSNDNNSTELLASCSYWYNHVNLYTCTGIYDLNAVQSHMQEHSKWDIKKPTIIYFPFFKQKTRSEDLDLNAIA